MWLAQVGSDRLDEIAGPEKAILRGADFYRAKGYTEGWINQRLQTIEMRKKLTDEMTKAWSGLTVKEYKELKGLKKENLRDNMTDIELVLNMLAEVTTAALSKRKKARNVSRKRCCSERMRRNGKRSKASCRKEVGEECHISA